jgi:tetratricopeptide (TPR) repeat protein
VWWPYPYPYVYPPGSFYLPGYDYAPWVLPPLYLPAEQLYGPEQVKRLMGADQMGLAPQTNVIVVPRGQDRDDADQPRRATNAKSMALGWRFIASGDAHFQTQEYAEAYRDYKKAAQAAPGLAEAYWRQAFALVGLANYDLAAKAMKKGMSINPNWADSGFRSDELYGANKMAKTAHLDGLAKAALDQPNNADLLMLVGVELYFDGQVDRAAPFFERATKLAPELGPLAAGFLKRAKAAEM